MNLYTVQRSSKKYITNFWKLKQGSTGKKKISYNVYMYKGWIDREHKSEVIGEAGAESYHDVTTLAMDIKLDTAKLYPPILKLWTKQKNEMVITVPHKSKMYGG